MKPLNTLKILIGTTGFLTILSLTGCASIYGPHGLIPEDSGQYQKAQQTAQLITPANIEPSNDTTPYYGIPPTTQLNTLPPSLVPPGSGLPPERQFFAQAPQGTVKPLFAEFKQTSTGEPFLLSNADFSTLWNILPLAIQNAGYRLIYQNPTLKIYYILDAAQTGGQLTKNTPIVQVHIAAATSTQTTITLTDNSNQPLPNLMAKRILVRLQHILLNPPSNSLWHRTIGAMFGVIK